MRFWLARTTLWWEDPSSPLHGPLWSLEPCFKKSPMPIAPEPTDAAEIAQRWVSLPCDSYHLQMTVVVVFEGDAKVDISPLTSPATPERREAGWPVKDEIWYLVLRQDIRDWLETNFGPYSPDGKYGVTKLNKEFGLYFRNYRDAIEFKMTWT